MAFSILVVERDPLTRETIVYMLEALHYNVTAAGCMESALASLAAYCFDVMIVSLRLGDPDGDVIAANAKMRQRDLKVIVASGRSWPDVLKPSIDAHVQKPFGLQDINDAIRKVLVKGAL